MLTVGTAIRLKLNYLQAVHLLEVLAARDPSSYAQDDMHYIMAELEARIIARDGWKDLPPNMWRSS